MAVQVWRQWRSGEVAGVSKLLFIGQFTASVLFTIYSAMKADLVFIVVNTALVINALAGMMVNARNSRLKSKVLS